MHTDRFVGDKMVNVYVLFDQPNVQEVSLEIKARSCEEVTVTPETLDFGRGMHGEVRKTQATVTFPALDQYQIQKVATDSHHVHVTVTDLPSEEGTRVYKLNATLDGDLPVGKWYTEVWLLTNQPGMERIRVPVRADVEPALLVSPADMKMETPAKGQRVQRKVLVHANSPFAIVAVKGTDTQWTVHDDTPGRAPQHILTVTLENAADGGLERSFQVVTDLPGTVEFHARAESGR